MKNIIWWNIELLVSNVDEYSSYSLKKYCSFLNTYVLFRRMIFATMIGVKIQVKLQ